MTAKQMVAAVIVGGTAGALVDATVARMGVCCLGAVVVGLLARYLAPFDDYAAQPRTDAPASVVGSVAARSPSTRQVNHAKSA